MKQCEIVKDYSKYNKKQLKSRGSQIMKVINDREEWTSDKFVKYRLPDIIFWRAELNKLSARMEAIT